MNKGPDKRRPSRSMSGRGGRGNYNSGTSSSSGRGNYRPRATTANSQPPDKSPLPEGMVFYCKSCEQIVDYKPETFNFKYPIENCLKAKSDRSEEKKAEMICDIAYGTERSIKHYYKIKDDKYDAERKEREDKAQRADKF